jgi:hypothetical protein
MMRKKREANGKSGSQKKCTSLNLAWHVPPGNCSEKLREEA